MTRLCLDRRLLLGTAAAVMLLAGFGVARADETPVQQSDAVWASNFKDLTDTVQPLPQWKGKTTVIYFFATWCVPCHLETPKLVKLYDTFKQNDMVVIGIALDNADTANSPPAAGRLACRGGWRDCFGRRWLTRTRQGRGFALNPTKGQSAFGNLCFSVFTG